MRGKKNESIPAANRVLPRPVPYAAKSDRLNRATNREREREREMPLRLGLPITSHCGHREGARYSGIYPRRKVLVRATFDVLRSLRSASTNRLSPDNEKSINYSRIYSTQPAPGIRTNARPTKARRMISVHEAVALSLKKPSSTFCVLCSK